MSPQGGLVADAKLQGHNRRHGQTREREVEDARAALWHVDVEARRHDRAVRSSTVHRYGDRAVRRPQERHLEFRAFLGEFLDLVRVLAPVGAFQLGRDFLNLFFQEVAGRAADSLARISSELHYSGVSRRGLFSKPPSA